MWLLFGIVNVVEIKLESVLEGFEILLNVIVFMSFFIVDGDKKF